MLRVSPKSEVTMLSLAKMGKYSFYLKKLQIFFGPVGGYIKWAWCLFSPAVLVFLLGFSVLGYHRVTFNNQKLPWMYEGVAWVAMVGPLFVVPFTVVYTIYETWKRHKPLSSVWSSENWRHKQEIVEASEPKHIVNPENDYAYIDPISRGPSAKSNRNFPSINVIGDDEMYARATERIREWTERNSRRLSQAPRVNELPSNSGDVIQVIEDQTNAESSEAPDVSDDQNDNYGWRSGRLRDFELVDDGQLSSKVDSDKAKPDRVSIGRSLSAERSRSQTPSEASEELNLFGPPPEPNGFEISMSDTVRYRSLNRRSDQKRSRAFEDAFNVIELAEIPTKPIKIVEPPASPISTSSVQPETRPRLYSEATDYSIGSLSINPVDQSYTNSNSTISSIGGRRFLKPIATRPPRLKRPQPIRNPSIQRKPSVGSSTSPL
uniref:Uncharacterized protein n=1 Tax=Acrobeloides nanus TaxID=290746 RepID=A0A914DYP9_9BILA